MVRGEIIILSFELLFTLVFVSATVTTFLKIDGTEYFQMLRCGSPVAHMLCFSSGFFIVYVGVPWEVGSFMTCSMMTG